MIVYGMSEKEVVREVLTDMVNAFRFEDANKNRFRRLVIKASRFPVYQHYVYTSKNKNKWIIILEARSKKEHGDMSRMTFVTVYNTPHGLYAIMVSWVDGKPELIFYPPHFFSRFRERTHKSVSGIDLIILFFRHNKSYVYDTKHVPVSEDKARMELYGSTRDGVALGFRTSESNIMFKTFITYDMLKGEQVEKFTQNEKIRQEIHN